VSFDISLDLLVLNMV